MPPYNIIVVLTSREEAPALRLQTRKLMDDPNNTTGTLDADEDILTYTVSDEAIEAAATAAAGAEPTHGVSYFAGCCSYNFCR